MLNPTTSKTWPRLSDMRRRSFLGLVPILILTPAGICSQPNPDFSGTWKLSGERSTPKRTGNTTLHIDDHDPKLTVETTIIRDPGAPRHAVQRYTTDGKVSISTGADGDEFHTSIIRENRSLVFSIEEHEDGRVILSRETWTLIENGAALERVREGAQGDSEKQTLIYLRVLAQDQEAAKIALSELRLLSEKGGS
jgi:hypothetical protein